MEGECFVCVRPANDKYGIVLPDGKVLQEKLLCERCVSDLREVEFIEIEESPVLMRGGESDNNTSG